MTHPRSTSSTAGHKDTAPNMTCEVCHSAEAQRLTLKAALTDGGAFVDICEKRFNIIKQNCKPVHYQ